MEGYGATELSPVISLSLPDVEIDGVRQTGSVEGGVGLPVPGVVVKIVDPESGETLPEGATVSRFAMRQGHGWQEGEVVETAHATTAYESFTHRRVDGVGDAFAGYLGEFANQPFAVGALDVDGHGKKSRHPSSIP